MRIVRGLPPAYKGKKNRINIELEDSLVSLLDNIAQETVGSRKRKLVIECLIKAAIKDRKFTVKVPW